MVVRIGSNIASQGAQRRLGEATSALSRSYERLSSGQRINRAGDDAAGLAIATSLRVDSRVFAQGIRNVNDGISFLAVAERAVGELKGIVIRQRELATQAANCSYSDTQRAALNTESVQLSSEYNRIIESASFNGRTIFSNTQGSLSLQAGYGAQSALSAEFGSADGVSQNDIGRASIDSSENQVNGHSYTPSVSGDGRYVAFSSNATNLVSGDTNGKYDIFVRDMLTGETTRVSTGTAGTQGDGDSFGPRLSADGRYVTFYSDSTNLVSGDGNAANDIFVKDLLTGELKMASVDSGEIQGNGHSYTSSISDDGRYVSFHSFASNLVSGDTFGLRDIFVRDLLAGETWRVSTSSAEAQANGSSLDGRISGDGNHVAFYSYATNLTGADGNGVTDVFVKNLLTEAVTMVSTSSGGTQGNGASSGASISEDGRYVAFYSDSSNLVTGDGNGTTDVFVKDLLTGETVRVSTASGGSEGDGASINPWISGDGRYVTFSSQATDLVAGDTNGVSDIFVKDLVTGEIRRVSTDSSGTEGGGASITPSISADGRYISFGSVATNLVAFDTNVRDDVFSLGNPFAGEWKIARSEWLSLTTGAGALAAQTRLDRHLEELNNVSGVIGALVSRFEKALGNLSSIRDNSIAAEGRIRDVDISSESASLARSRIVQEVGAAVLAQANQAPALALKLLGSID